MPIARGCRKPPTPLPQASAIQPAPAFAGASISAPHVWEKIRILVFLLTLLPPLAFGQQRTSAYRPDILRFGDGVVYTYSAPARWNGHDWAVFGGVVAGTAALTFLDEPVRALWLRHDNRFLNGVERVGYHYGKPYSAIGFTAGMYLGGVLFRNAWARETGLILGTTLFTSGSVMGVLKNVAGRGRPAPGMDNMEFRPFDESPAWHSFPSGHNSIAFGISLVMARRVESVPLKIVFYSLAGTTAVSRMYSDSHWLSDVGFGGMLAWFCVDAAIDRMQVNRVRTFSGPKTFVWKVYPYPGGITLRASVR